MNIQRMNLLLESLGARAGEHRFIFWMTALMVHREDLEQTQERRQIAIDCWSGAIRNGFVDC